MKLYSSPASPFGRKTRIIAHALGLKLEEITSNPLEDAGFRKLNPLGKIPALETDDGQIIFDSRVICEYLDRKGGGKFFPADDAARFKALTLQALGDGIADAAVAYMLLGRETTPPELARARHLKTIAAGLDALEAAPPGDELRIGEVALASALIYVDLRMGVLEWRASRPNLAAWQAKIAAHPSIKATA